MRFDILVQVVREGFIWWFKNGWDIKDHDVWERLFVAIEEGSTGWLEAVRIANDELMDADADG